MKVAVFNTAFLGDAILSLPLLQSLDSVPNVELDFFVRKGFGELFNGLENNFKSIEFDKKHYNLLTTYNFARHLGYDVLISAHNSFRTSLVAFFSQIPIRIGYDTHLHQRLAYTQTVSRDFDKLEEIERLNNLLKPLQEHSFFANMLIKDKPEITLKPEFIARADNFFTKLEGRPVLGIHPGSTWATKRWINEYYAEIIEKAVKSDVHILVFGALNEVDILKDIFVHLDIKTQNSAYIHNLMGQLSLPELCAYLKKLDCYLSNDSGPMHLAWAQDTPLVALFGPTVRRFGFFPRGPMSQVMEIERELSCRPCNLHGPKVCPEHTHACMLEIKPERVWQAIAQNLGARV